jgi:hypothetical protein
MQLCSFGSCIQLDNFVRVLSIIQFNKVGSCVILIHLYDTRWLMISNNDFIVNISDS